MMRSVVSLRVATSTRSVCAILPPACWTSVRCGAAAHSASMRHLCSQTRGALKAASPTSTSTSTQVAAEKSSNASASAIHKVSTNTGDAAAYAATADDIPSYSAPRHMGYLALHSRRIWLPLVMAGVYYALTPYVLATQVQQGLYATACVLLQRFSVRGRMNTIQKDLRGRMCVVTGGTSGIGLYTAMELLRMGAHVIIASKPGKEAQTMEFFQAYAATPAKSASKDDAAANEQPLAPLEQRVTFVPLDLSDQLDVKACAAKIKALCSDHVDLLVNCAAVLKEEPGLSKQGFEEHIAVNFLGPFHFTEALLPALRKSRVGGRIVYVTCSSHGGVRHKNIVQERMTLKPSPEEMQLTARCYSASKLGNIYHAQSIAERRYEGISLNQKSGKSESGRTPLRPVTVCCADPGFCATNLDRDVTPFLGTSSLARAIRSLWIKDPSEGCQTVVNCCVRDDVENGEYYAECTAMPSGLSKRAQDEKSRQEVIHWAYAKTIAKYYSGNPSATSSGSGASSSGAPTAGADKKH